MMTLHEQQEEEEQQQSINKCHRYSLIKWCVFSSARQNILILFYDTLWARIFIIYC